MIPSNQIKIIFYIIDCSSYHEFYDILIPWCKILDCIWFFITKESLINLPTIIHIISMEHLSIYSDDMHDVNNNELTCNDGSEKWNKMVILVRIH